MAIIKPFTFRAGEKARAAEVNQNFDILYQEVNNQASEIQSLEDDITSIENSKANINGNSSQRFAVADAVGAYDAINRHTLEAIYPIGAIYIGTTDECPLSSLFGTWEKVSGGRVLQGSDDTHSAGSTIAAGLPDHKHILGTMYTTHSGTSGNTWIRNYPGDSTQYSTSYASVNNTIYGRSDTVQPPAYVVNIWERVS